MSADTQNQALNDLIFLYREMLSAEQVVAELKQQNRNESLHPGHRSAMAAILARTAQSAAGAHLAGVLIFLVIGLMMLQRNA